MKKVLYVASLNLGVVMWRIESYAQELVKMKDDCAVFVEYFFNPEENIPWDKVCLDHGDLSDQIRAKLEAAFSEFDYIIFQKIQHKNALILLDALKKRFPETKVIAELDDSVGEITPSNIHDFSSHHTYAAEHCMRSDAIIVSTGYLGRSLRKIVGKDKPIHVAPNCINKDIWNIENKDLGNNDLLNIVYVGGGGHDEDIKIIYPSIKKILKERTDVKFTFRYGGFRPDFLEDHPRIDFKSIGWHIRDYPQKLYELNADIALAPLRDTEFNRCKSNVKYLEWSYLNVPLICSNVEPFKETEGFLTKVDNNVSDWTYSLKAAIEEYSKTTTRSNVLRASCLEKYNQKKECDKLLTFLGDL